ncbi:TPA: hypothetical protein ACG3KH_004185 [Clostridioides difficile]
MALPVEQEAQLLVDLYEVYKINDLDIDDDLSQINKNIILKTNKFGEENTDIRTMAGYILAYSLKMKEILLYLKKL